MRDGVGQIGVAHLPVIGSRPFPADDPADRTHERRPRGLTNKGSGGWRELLSGAGTRSVSVAGAGVFTGSAAETRLKGNALAGTLDDYELSFEGGERMRGRFLLTRLDYSGDFNGERTYTLALESSGAVTSL
ncbi:phage tail tube protein [uncultured Sphingomonas sp.]|uniref:phage tail tube protein n=1 Tax=uncultured Sphingomonas sp. TaxID=158754 RepID=UPI0026015AF2|nr:phage tail tube protein [uncultured Sphingomonas sp.]